MFLDLELEWWQFCIIAALLFVGCLFINYVTKRINEARMEERFARLLQKTPNSQVTQTVEPGLERDQKLLRTPSANNAEGPIASGISLVFNKEANILHDLNRKHDPKEIKKALTSNLDDIAEETLKKENNVTDDENNGTRKNKADIENTKTKQGSIFIKDSKERCDASSNVPTVIEATQKTLSQLISDKSMNNILEQESSFNSLVKISKVVCTVPTNSDLEIVKTSQKEDGATPDTMIYSASKSDDPTFAQEIVSEKEESIKATPSIILKDSKATCYISITSEPLTSEKLENTEESPLPRQSNSNNQVLEKNPESDDIVMKDSITTSNSSNNCEFLISDISSKTEESMSQNISNTITSQSGSDISQLKGKNEENNVTNNNIDLNQIRLSKNTLLGQGSNNNTGTRQINLLNNDDLTFIQNEEDLENLVSKLVADKETKDTTIQFN